MDEAGIRRLLLEGSYELAAKEAAEGLRADPRNAELWNLKGAALRSLGLVGEAQECFEESLRLDPRDRASS